MRNPALAFILLITSLLLFGCRNTPPSESAFKAGFSLNSIVEANKQYLTDEARVVSGAETGSPEDFVQSYEQMSLQIDPADVPEFMGAVRGGIEQSLLDSGARILGSQSDGSDHFMLAYEENGLHGAVHVWGVPGGQASFTLIMLITEK